jgi:L-seryl-tRNA(Ser) seleniumtransferase
MKPATSLRDLPSVDRVLRELGRADIPRPLLTQVVRSALATLRDSENGCDPMPMIHQALDDLRRSRVQRVVNGTGIIIHTNLGRAPLAVSAAQASMDAALGYTNLEFDLDAGERGDRAGYLERCLAILAGAPAATVVNNCAAALVLVLRHFTSRPQRRDVIISRGELVQIGGGFRVPEILEASGAVLREVGTTNRTAPQDYRRAVDERTAMILHVHRSNFYMDGFVSTPALAELRAVASEAGVPLVVDLGTGATFDSSTLGDEREPTAQRAIADGADVVTFSGDKLLGGPQAGIIAGGAAIIEALKREPFFRALRCDKLVICALQATVELILDRRENEIPIRAMIDTSVAQLAARCQTMLAALADVPLALRMSEMQSAIGGGCLPRTTIASIGLEAPDAPKELPQRLRRGTPPVIGYTAGGVFRLDLRTIFPREDVEVVAALRQAMNPDSRT